MIVCAALLQARAVAAGKQLDNEKGSVVYNAGAEVAEAKTASEHSQATLKTADGRTEEAEAAVATAASCNTGCGAAASVQSSPRHFPPAEQGQAAEQDEQLAEPKAASLSGGAETANDATLKEMKIERARAHLCQMVTPRAKHEEELALASHAVEQVLPCTMRFDHFMVAGPRLW